MVNKVGLHSLCLGPAVQLNDLDQGRLRSTQSSSKKGYRKEDHGISRLVSADVKDDEFGGMCYRL